MKKLIACLFGLLFSVPAFADQCNMLPSMDTWSNGGTDYWIPTLYTTQKTFSFPITISHSSIVGGYQNVPVKLVKVKPNTKYTVYTDVSVSGTDKSGFEVAGYATEADATVSSAGTNRNKTFYLGDSVQPKTTTFTTTATTEYVVVSITNWGSGTDLTITAENKVIMVEGDSITNTNIPQCGATTLNSLPSGYQQLEYLEGTGTQAVDTGLVFNKNNSYQVSIDFMPLATNSAMQCVAGCEINKGNWSMISVIQANSQRMVVYQSANVSGQSLGTLSLNRKYSLVMEQKYDMFTASLDGTQIINQNNPSSNITYSSVSTYSLFADHYESSTGYTQFFKGRIYSAKIVVNDVITRQMVPARRVSDGVLGMYDLADSNANTAFHTNAGTGTFIAGPTIIPNTFERLQYIESTGTQYIDTGIVGNQDTKVDIDFVVTGGPGTPFWPFGSRTDSNQAAFAIWGSSGTVGSTFRVGFDGTQGYSGNEITQNTRYHVISSKEGIYMNGTLEYTPTGYSSFTTPSNLMLFAAYNRGTVQTGTNMQLFSCSLYDNGTLSFNGVPVKRLSDGEVGMFDTVTGAFLTNSGTGDFVAGPSAVMKIATTKYNNTAFGPVVTALNNAVDTIKTVVANTINQATAVANLQSGKQTKPTDTCPSGKICLLVEDEAGTPHWYEIIERAPGIVPAGSGYTQVEYLQSDGNSYIDTGVYLTNNHSLDIKFMSLSSETGSLFGTRVASNGAGFGITGQTSLAVDLYGAGQLSQSRLSQEISLNNIYSIHMESGNRYIKNAAGTTLGTNTVVASAFTINKSAPLFAINWDTNEVRQFGRFRVYEFTLKENGTAVRDFVPARRNSDGVLGMYDTVSGNFFTNAGTGEFTAPGYLPASYTQLTYLQSDGTAWINTGIVFDTLNTKVEIGADIIAASKNLFGFNASDADTNWYTLYDATFQSYFANSISSKLGNLGAGTSGVKRDIVVTTNSSNQLLIDVNGTNVIDKTFTGTFIVNNQPSVAIFTTNGKMKNSRITTGTKVWYTRLYKDGTLVRDMVPAQHGTDVGMYDLVNNQFYTNQGSGTFTAGPVAQ